MTGITDEEKGKRDLMTDLAKFTKLDPGKRLQIIKSLPIEEKFRKDGFALTEIENFKGILLNPPAIILGKNSSMKPKDGNFMIRDCIFDPATLSVRILIKY